MQFAGARSHDWSVFHEALHRFVHRSGRPAAVRTGRRSGQRPGSPGRHDRQRLLRGVRHRYVDRPRALRGERQRAAADRVDGQDDDRPDHDGRDSRWPSQTRLARHHLRPRQQDGRLADFRDGRAGVSGADIARGVDDPVGQRRRRNAGREDRRVGGELRRHHEPEGEIAGIEAEHLLRSARASERRGPQADRYDERARSGHPRPGAHEIPADARVCEDSHHALRQRDVHIRIDEPESSDQSGEARLLRRSDRNQDRLFQSGGLLRDRVRQARRYGAGRSGHGCEISERAGKLICHRFEVDEQRVCELQPGDRCEEGRQRRTGARG